MYSFFIQVSQLLNLLGHTFDLIAKIMQNYKKNLTHTSTCTRFFRFPHLFPLFFMFHTPSDRSSTTTHPPSSLPQLPQRHYRNYVNGTTVITPTTFLQRTNNAHLPPFPPKKLRKVWPITENVLNLQMSTGKSSQRDACIK